MIYVEYFYELYYIEIYIFHIYTNNIRIYITLFWIDQIVPKKER